MKRYKGSSNDFRDANTSFSKVLVTGCAGFIGSNLIDQAPVDWDGRRWL